MKVYKGLKEIRWSSMIVDVTLPHLRLTLIYSGSDYILIAERKHMNINILCETLTTHVQAHSPYGVWREDLTELTKILFNFNVILCAMLLRPGTSIQHRCKVQLLEIICVIGSNSNSYLICPQTVDNSRSWNIYATPTAEWA